MKHIVSCSLGKDSVAMLLMMIEKGMQIDEIVWANTSMEFPENYPYLRKLEAYIGRKITVVRPTITFDKWFYRVHTKGRFKGRIHGFPYALFHDGCCRDFKETILTKAHNLIKGEKTVYVGYTFNEPERNMQDKKNIHYVYPLRDWMMGDEDCKNYLLGKGLLNPLYDRFTRIGCWLCPKQSKQSLKSLWKYYPKLWNKLKHYEADSPHGFKPKFALVMQEQIWLKQKEFEESGQKLLDVSQ